MDLQLFAEERTEEATPRKLQEARKEGRAARSADLAAGIGLVASTMALQFFGQTFYEQLAGGMVHNFSGAGRTDLTQEGLLVLLTDWAIGMMKALVPFAAVLAVIGLLVSLLQTRFLVTLNSLAPKAERISPISGFGRIFSTNTVVEQIKGLLKLALIGWIAYAEVAALLRIMPNLLGQPVAVGVVAICTTLIDALMSIGYVLLAIGVLDYGYQYWSFRKSLRMSKDEVKREHKEQDGSPELKQRQRQTQREMARRRKALQDVPQADVIITNPTHYAIAISYAAGKESAPRVVAKGTDLLAQQIKTLARDHQVPTVENRQLARTLYATVEVGEPVPPELYQAVAEVLAFVYSLRRQERHLRPS
jgi:flagellar biosynthetic protein FlhB